MSSPDHTAGDDLLAFEQVQLLHDKRSGARAVIAVHDTRFGPAFGGIRRWRYVDVEQAADDARELAAAMTWKCAMAELPAGGGKAVLLDSPDLDRRVAYEFLADHVEQMRGRFVTGPDVGTSDDDLRAAAARTRFCADPDDVRWRGLADSTARGVFAAMRATAQHIGADLAGLRVLVQGLGAVGSRLCELLARASAKLLVADLSPSAVERAVTDHGAEAIAPDRALATPCDVFSPCALGGVLDERIAKDLPARAVCGAANNPFADDKASAVLHARGIPVAPDFVANAGGLIHGVALQLAGELPSAERIDRTGEVVSDLLARSRAEDIPPRELAMRIVRERLASVSPHPFLPPT